MTEGLTLNHNADREAPLWGNRLVTGNLKVKGGMTLVTYTNYYPNTSGKWLVGLPARVG